jgi:hypothetical protein
MAGLHEEARPSLKLIMEVPDGAKSQPKIEVRSAAGDVVVMVP